MTRCAEFKVADCAWCGRAVYKNYRFSAARKRRPIYCSVECQKKRQELQAEDRRARYFWTKIDCTGAGCWPWLGYTDPNGYGRYGRILAHRVAFELARDPIPEGQCVCHQCDNPLCCNPAHLWLGTQIENVADMDAKGRRILPQTRRGEASNKAKLTAEQALTIFHSTERQTTLARRFGITPTSVRHIKMGVNWAHVTKRDAQP